MREWAGLFLTEGASALLEDVGNYLATQGLGLSEGTNLFLGTLPDQPDDAVALYETGGGAPSLVDSTDTPSWQVRVRNTDYATGRSMIETIWNALHGLTAVALGGTTYKLIWALQSPVAVGRDIKQRHEWTANFRAYRENPDANQHR